MSSINISLYAGLAEHMHALSDDDILLPFMTHIATQQGPEPLQLFLCLVSQAILAFGLMGLLQLTVHCL